MRRTPSYLKVSVLLALFLVVVGVMACGPTAPAPTPRATQERAELAKVPPPTPTIPAIPTEIPALTAPDDSCVSCHTEKEQLIATAKEEEVAEELSEGEG